MNQRKKSFEDKVILIEDLDQFNIDLWPYAYFIMLYIFNATLALPVFILKMVWMFFVDLIKMFKMKSIGQFIEDALLHTVCYFIDVVMALSVLMMYPMAFYATQLSVNYQYWAISCLIFLQSQILMSTYMQTIAIDLPDMSFGYLFQNENMHSLGLGRVINQLDKSKQSIGQQRNELQKHLYEYVHNSMDSENIDSTFYYFALDSDEGILKINEFAKITQETLNFHISNAKLKLQQQQMLYDKIDRLEFESDGTKENILRAIRSQGFRGCRHAIDNLLWPHYQYIKELYKPNSGNLFMIVVLVLVLKGAYPCFAIYSNSTDTKQELYYVLCFIGMYINMVSLLIGLVVNDDLKGKKHILNVLETMMIPNKVSNADQDDGVSNQTETPSDLPFNNKFKLDLSCNLSLETWDNIRRLTIGLDQQKQDFNEATFSFLAIYFIYTYLAMSSAFLDFNLVMSIAPFFQDPISISNAAVDFILLTLLFVNRVNEGSMFNGTFERMQETIKYTSLIYEDKKALFDFYFSSNLMENIQNETYRRIAQQIQIAAADKVIYNLALSGNQSFDLQQFFVLTKMQAKQKINQLCATMSKLNTQLEFDSEHFSHKMLGAFKSDISKLFSTFMLLIYIFFHSKIKSYMNSHKKADPDAPAHHHHNESTCDPNATHHHNATLNGTDVNAPDANATVANITRFLIRHLL